MQNTPLILIYTIRPMSASCFKGNRRMRDFFPAGIVRYVVMDSLPCVSCVKRGHPELCQFLGRNHNVGGEELHL
jgi:predicted nucleic acid binding AN1-type Zn finger protein